MANQPRQTEEKKTRKGTRTLYEAQRVRTLAQARREWLRVKQLQGELVLRSAVEQMSVRVAREVRDRLQNLPARISGMIASFAPGCAQEQIHALLSKEIHQCLEEIAG